jgi:hypothetical protein
MLKESKGLITCVRISRGSAYVSFVVFTYLHQIPKYPDKYSTVLGTAFQLQQLFSDFEL